MTDKKERESFRVYSYKYVQAAGSRCLVKYTDKREDILVHTTKISVT